MNRLIKTTLLALSIICLVTVQPARAETSWPKLAARAVLLIGTVAATYYVVNKWENFFGDIRNIVSSLGLFARASDAASTAKSGAANLFDTVKSFFGAGKRAEPRNNNVVDAIYVPVNVDNNDVATDQKLNNAWDESAKDVTSVASPRPTETNPADQVLEETWEEVKDQKQDNPIDIKKARLRAVKVLKHLMPKKNTDEKPAKLQARL